MLDINNGINLIKFSATWCMPCKVVAKTIKNILEDYSSLEFQDIDIDDNPNLAKDYKIRSIPTVIVFNNSKEVTRFVGNFKVEELKKVLNDLLKNKAA